MKGDHGLTVVELLLYGSVVAFMGMVIARLLPSPTILTQTLNAATIQNQAYHALGRAAQDFQGAIGLSVTWNPPVDQMPCFEKTNPSDMSSPHITQVHYFYDPAAAPVGNLQRWEGALGVPCDDASGALTTILSRVIKPSAAAPLFQQDPAAPSVLIMTVAVDAGPYRLRSGGKGNQNQITVSRRIAVRS